MDPITATSRPLGPKNTPVSVWSLVAAALLVSAGCGGHDSPGRRPLHGTVRIDGDRVTAGALTWLPVQGNAGPAASTSIVDGRYEFTETTGPVAGPHRVILGVSALDESAGGGSHGAAADPRKDSGSAAESTSASASDSAPAGSVKKNALSEFAHRSGNRPSAPSQLELRFDVPPEGDLRVDLMFETP